MGDSFRSDVLFFNAFPKAGLVAATAVTTSAIKIRHWKVKTVAINNDQGAEAGPPSDVLVDVLVKLRDGKFTPLKGASGGIVVANKVFTFSFEDVFEEMKVRVTPGVTLPERISIQVNAGRETIG
jgi:hypothetical protein